MKPTFDFDEEVVSAVEWKDMIFIATKSKLYCFRYEDGAIHIVPLEATLVTKKVVTKVDPNHGPATLSVGVTKLDPELMKPHPIHGIDLHVDREDNNND